nr:hypothetical protein OA32_02615 [Oenococcus oeni X2L]
MIVIDHHRIADESFSEKPILFYVEQYASSTCELVTELLGYEDRRKSPLTKVEATALLGGIQLDTKGFTSHSGSRTFDAASFCGQMEPMRNCSVVLARNPRTIYWLNPIYLN